MKNQIRLSDNQQKLEQYAHKMETLAQERAVQLVHKDRLSTLGTLAAGLAHEINNPATFIMTNLKAMENYFEYFLPHIEKMAKGTGSEARFSVILKELPQAFVDMRSGVERISNIINVLLDYSRKREQFSDKINLADCLNDALVFTGHRLNNIETELNIPHYQCTINGSRQQIT